MHALSLQDSFASRTKFSQRWLTCQTLANQLAESESLHKNVPVACGEFISSFTQNLAGVKSVWVQLEQVESCSSPPLVLECVGWAEGSSRPMPSLPLVRCSFTD